MKVFSNVAVTLAQAIKPADITVSGAKSSLVVNQTPLSKLLQTTSNVSGIGGNDILSGCTTEPKSRSFKSLGKCSNFWKKM